MAMVASNCPTSAQCCLFYPSITFRTWIASARNPIFFPFWDFSLSLALSNSSKLTDKISGELGRVQWRAKTPRSIGVGYSPGWSAPRRLASTTKCAGDLPRRRALVHTPYGAGSFHRSANLTPVLWPRWMAGPSLSLLGFTP
jgi:hypothetical protein